MGNLNMPLSRAARTRPSRHPVRRDFFSANIVELGIALQKEFGTTHAARFMKDNWISIDVALRVLLHPALRRSLTNGNTDLLKLPEWKNSPEIHAL